MRRQYFLKKSQAIVEGQQQELGAALPPRAHFSGGQEGRNLFLLNIEGFEHHHLLPDPCAGSVKLFNFFEIKPIKKEYYVSAAGGLEKWINWQPG